MPDFPQPIEYDVLPKAIMDYSTLTVIGNVAGEVLSGARLRRTVGLESGDIILVFDLHETKSDRGEFSSWLISADPKLFRIQGWPDEVPQKNVPTHLVEVMSHHLDGARVDSVKVTPFERIITINFIHRDYTGEENEFRLIVELMGKHSNIILLDGNDMILASRKAVHSFQSRIREVRAGKVYRSPPKQDRIEPTEFDKADWRNFLGSACIDVELDNHFVSTFHGMSLNWAHGISFRAGVADEVKVPELSPEDAEKLRLAFIESLKLMRDGLPLTGETPENFVRRVSLDFYERAEDFALDRARLKIMKIINRRRKKLQALGKGLIKDIDQSGKADVFKKKADLLLANMHRVIPGIDRIEVTDWESGENVVLNLDTILSPQLQVERWFKRYRKLQRTHKVAMDRRTAVVAEEEELTKLEVELASASSIDEINYIREQCVLRGLIAPHEFKAKGQDKRRVDRKGHRPGDRFRISTNRYRSNDGFLIIAGTNNLSNDALKRSSSPEDIWLHTRDIPGSHVYIITRGKKVPDTTLKEAAMVAAWHSKAREGSNVPVDYTKSRYVTPIPGAPPGKVRFKRERTIRVTPEEKRVEMMKMMAGGDSKEL